jgi:CopA family copper-resistance protein
MSRIWQFKNNELASARQGLSRRRFVQGAVGGALLLGAGSRFSLGAQSPLTELAGSEFALSIGELAVNIIGKKRIATVVNGQLPAPLLRWRQGDTVTIRVTNHLSVPTSIHWHGLIVPADMDGVPGLSFGGINAGETFTYRFKVNQSGTYWYHSHSRFQEQVGLYGPIIVDRRGDEMSRADREHVVLLSDWTDNDPEQLFRTLKKQSKYFNFGQRTAGDFVRDARAQGFSHALSERNRWGQMRMDPTDLMDVSGYAYTYLMNGVAPANNWTGIFKRGEKVRLRFINGSSMSIFDVRIPGLKLTVVAADGQEVDPVTVEEFRIAAAETYDVIVEPKGDSAYTIFAQALDRSGYACGTLAPQPGMQATVPSVDPRSMLSMADMAMGHDMSGDMSGMDHSKMNHGPGEKANLPQHAREEYGPTVDSLAEQPQSRLDDPGVGLRGNGRRVLTYADLHTIGGPIDHRMPDREIELHLTGHMERFVWSFNGQKFSQAEPLRFNHGERLRIVLVNDSMMTHPIHLHGMWSELETEHGEFLVRKHSVMVQPGQRLSYAVTADALGRWAYHCHLLYHMEAGMFREVVVAHSKAG